MKLLIVLRQIICDRGEYFLCLFLPLNIPWLFGDHSHVAKHTIKSNIIKQGCQHPYVHQNQKSPKNPGWEYVQYDFESICYSEE